MTLHESGRPICFVFNKIDKIKSREVDAKIVAHLDLLTASARTAVVPFSTQTGAGRQAVWAWIRDCLSL
jgi:GTP-binding protein EngB required for normal cell division